MQKKLLSLLLVLAMVLSLAPMALATDGSTKTMSSLTSDGGTTFTAAEAGDTVTIQDAAELVLLQKYTDAKCLTKGVTFQLTSNIDLSTVCYPADEANSKEAVSWTPIGAYASAKRFKGTFDGAGKTVSNLYILIDADEQGLLGYIDETAIIKNLTMQNATVSGAENVGAVVGCSSDATLQNLTTQNVKVSGKKYVGAVVGRSDDATLQNLTIEATCRIEGAGRTGGVVGQASGVVENCTNAGEVVATGLNADTGGIVGNFYGPTITNCSNSGKINGQTAGGVVGNATSGEAKRFVNCVNTGNVDGVRSVGGICGDPWGDDGIMTEFISCRNAADLTVESEEVAEGVGVGGISGAPLRDIDSGVINNRYYNCSNTGNITVKHGVAAGIAAGLNYSKYDPGDNSIEDCWSTGTVTAQTGTAGGLVGYLNHNAVEYGAMTFIRDSYVRTTAVSGSDYAGGLIGRISVLEGTTGNRGVYLNNCYSTVGAVTAAGESGKAGASIGAVDGDVQQVYAYNILCETISGKNAIGEGTVNGVTAKSAAELKAADLGCHFTADSGSSNAGYPVLYAQKGEEIPADSLSSKITFIVKDWEGNVTSDAVVTVTNRDSSETLTAGEGSVYTVPAGKYNYTVDLKTCYLYTGFFMTCAPANSDKTIEVTMTQAQPGEIENPHKIATADDLTALADRVNNTETPDSCAGEYFVQTADIDLAGIDWAPIGLTKSAAFQGNYDGGNYTISNLKVDGYSAGGLFGWVTMQSGKAGAVLQNIRVVGGDISAEEYAGGIAGRAGGTGWWVSMPEISFTNCYFSGSVKTTGNTAYAGGIAGYSLAGITRCGAEATVIAEGTESYFGGICPYTYPSSGDISVSNSWFAGEVKSETSYRGCSITNYNTKNITNCFSVGSVSGVGAYNDRYFAQFTCSIGDGNYGTNTGNFALNQSQRNYMPDQTTKVALARVFSEKQKEETGNYGYVKMLLNGEAVTCEDPLDPNGKDITAQQALTAQTYRDAGWDESIWTLKDGMAPALKGMPAPSAASYKYLSDDAGFVPVHFDAGEGSAVEDVYVVKGNQLTKPEDPTREGCLFAGWYTDEALTTAFDFETGTVSGEMTLHAKWTPAITVYFTLLGDSVHDATAGTHTLKDENLTTWIERTEVVLPENSTVYDLFTKVLDENGYTYVGADKNYIETITTPDGVELSEFTNGDYSGWMFTVDGEHPDEGLQKWTLKDQNEVVWHYTDDYRRERTDVKTVFNDLVYSNGKDHWAVPAVQYVYDNGLMNGMKADVFGPEVKLDRSQLVTILWRMEGKPISVDGKDFTDVTSTASNTAWFYDAVQWASAEGIVNGKSETIFDPFALITREQAAAMFHRYAVFKDKASDEKADLSKYADAGKISSWAKDDLAWANGVGLINGQSETKLAPLDGATRAEAATILQRFCEQILK